MGFIVGTFLCNQNQKHNNTKTLILDENVNNAAAIFFLSQINMLIIFSINRIVLFLKRL